MRPEDRASREISGCVGFGIVLPVSRIHRWDGPGKDGVGFPRWFATVPQMDDRGTVPPKGHARKGIFITFLSIWGVIYEAG